MIRAFLKYEASGGILLFMAAAFAVVLANTGLGGPYISFLDAPVQVRIGQLDIAEPLLLLDHDALVDLFSLLGACGRHRARRARR